MNDLRTAAQQALEALESCDTAHPSDGGRQWYDDKLVEPAITTLRAALAEPCPCGDRPADQCPGEWEPGCDLGNPKYAKRAEPVQEPDLYHCPNCASLEEQNTELDRKLADRKPLTEDEIDRITRDRWGTQLLGVMVQAHREYARAVEAAHGIIETKIQGDKA